MSSFHLKLAPSTVLAALKKLRAERPATFEKMDTFIFRNPAGWAVTATGLGALLPGSDDRSPKANRGRGNLFLGQELGAWFAKTLDLETEIAARTSDVGDNLPGTCLALFTWDSINIGDGEVTFVLRPEFAAAFYLLSAEKLAPVAA
jgi:hypothetical protein